MNFETGLQHIQQLSESALVYLSDKANIEKIGKITAISVATYVVANKLHDAFLGPLSSVPGPWIGKFMNVPKLLLDNPRGTRDYHDVYGDVVRLGPKTIAVSEKNLIKEVILTSDLPKGPSFKIFQGNGKLSVFSATDKEWHKTRRRLIAPAFSIKYLNSLESYVQNISQSLVTKIAKDITQTHDNDGYGQVDIWTLLKSFSLDVIGEVAFGSSFNMIEDNSHFIPKAVNDEMRAGAISAMYPILSKIFLKDGGKMNPKLTDLLTNIIETRMAEVDNKRKDILQSLINTQDAEDEADRLDTAAIMGETGLFLIAGSETTSNTIGFILINLLRTPKALARLVAEIDQVELKEGQSFYDHDQVKNLPYLNAVFNETMRINTAAGAALERITEEPMRLGNLDLEKDTIVLANLYHAHTNEKYWPNPYIFKPERWLPEEQNESEINDFEAFFAFSAGSRNCVGKNFALLEMRLCLVALLQNFEFTGIPQELEDAYNLRTFITMTVAKHSFEVKVKRRSPL